MAKIGLDMDLKIDPKKRSNLAQHAGRFMPELTSTKGLYRKVMMFGADSKPFDRGSKKSK